MVVIYEKINQGFVDSTKSKQATGLSVCLGMIAKLDHRLKVIQKRTAEEVYLSIKALEPKAVIFEAMAFSYVTLIECKRMFPHVQIYVHLHSKFPFLGVEHGAANFIDNCVKHGIKVIFNHRDALNMFPFDGCLFLPNVYNSRPVSNRTKLSTGNTELHVGCHGSIRHLKNHVVQAAAACRYAKKINRQLYFHVNHTRNDGELNHILPNLERVLNLHGGRIVKDPWMNHDEFISHVSSLDLGMQVSLCETFNIVAADYVRARLPLVVSPEIDWAYEESKANPTDIADIVSKMHKAITRNDLIEANSNCLVEHNIKAVYDWEVFLSNYLEGVSSGF